MLPSNLQALYASWDTAASETSELILIGPHGILSAKLVVSQGGKVKRVFTGFEAAYWEWDESDLSSIYSNLMQHRYSQAMLRACNRWGAPTSDLLVGTIDEILGKLPDDVFVPMIEAFSDAGSKAQHDFKLFKGSDTASIPTKSPTKAKNVVRGPSRSERHRLALERDAEYGVF